MSRIRKFLPLAAASFVATAALAAPSSASAAERCYQSAQPVKGGHVMLETCVYRSADRTKAYAHSWLTVSDSSRVRLYSGWKVSSRLHNTTTGKLRVDWGSLSRDFVWQGGGRRTYGTPTITVVHPVNRFHSAGRGTFDVIGDGRGAYTISGSSWSL